MRRLRKGLLGAAMAGAMVLSLVPVGSVDSLAKESEFVYAGEETELDGLVSGDYSYEYLSDGTAEITFYDGSDTDVVIPSIIGGRPVSSIATQAFIGLGLGNMKSVVIPEGVTKIGKRAFDICTNLSSVTLPASLEMIDEEAFIGASSLSKITIPSKVATIGASAFSDCTNLTEVTISNGVKTIGNKAFYNCKALTKITIPNSVTTVENYAFWNCLSLAKVEIPSSMTSIPTGMFYNCTKLTDITIPKSVTSIGENAFNNCKNLTIHAQAGSAAANYADKNGIKHDTSTGGGTSTGDNKDPGNSTSKTKITSNCITVKSSFAYKGTAIEPAVTVKVGSKKLVKNTDYTVSYKNNTKVGKASVTVTGKGNYTGTATKTFKILPRKQTIKKLTGTKKGFKVTYVKRKSAEVTGYQVRYAVTKAKLKKAKPVSIKSYKKNTAAIKKLKAKKKYFVQVRAYKKIGTAAYYGAWSKAKKVTTKK